MQTFRPAPKVVNLQSFMKTKTIALPTQAPQESATPAMSARTLVETASQISPMPTINLPPLRILPSNEMTLTEAPSVASYGPDRTPLTPPILQGEFAEAPSGPVPDHPLTWQQKVKYFYDMHQKPILIGGAGLGVLLLLLLAAGMKEKKHARRHR
jgi:hypothetical protein